jgi:hypothetical protein
MENTLFTIQLTGQEIYDLTQHLSRTAIRESSFDELSLCVALHHRIVAQVRDQGYGLPRGHYSDTERAQGLYRIGHVPGSSNVVGIFSYERAVKLFQKGYEPLKLIEELGISRRTAFRLHKKYLDSQRSQGQETKMLPAAVERGGNGAGQVEVTAEAIPAPAWPVGLSRQARKTRAKPKPRGGRLDGARVFLEAMP